MCTGETSVVSTLLQSFRSRPIAKLAKPTIRAKGRPFVSTRLQFQESAAFCGARTRTRTAFAPRVRSRQACQQPDMQRSVRLPKALETELQAETPFSGRELRRLWTRFQALDTDSAGSVAGSELKNINELLYNPFAARIAEVFSDDGTGRLTFKNFLELFTVFSHGANFDVKVIFLFAIWDFDGDDLVGRDDIHKGLQLLLSEPPEAPIAPGATVVDVAIDWDETEILSPTQVSQVLAHIAAETDPDKDNGLTFQDFQSIMQHAPDFVSNFHISP